MGHARAMIAIEDVDKQLYVYNETISKDLSVRKVEEMVRDLGKGKEEKADNNKQPHKLKYEYQKIQDDLSSKFGSKIQVKVDDKGKGTIAIPFLSDNDLNRILELLDW